MKRAQAITALLAVLIHSSFAWAQELGKVDTEVPGGLLMTITYFGFVAFIIGYLALLSFRQRRLDADIEGLEKRLDEIAEID